MTPRLAAADAFVVVTPEYNHSYPAPVKTLIDWHFTEWQAKPVGFVSYGGMSGGLRAVEHLRGVFAELHAVTVRDTVSFHGAWDRFGPDAPPGGSGRVRGGGEVDARPARLVGERAAGSPVDAAVRRALTSTELQLLASAHAHPAER